MLSLNEHKNLLEDMESLVKLLQYVDDAEYYDIEEDEETYNITVTLYDSNENVLISVECDDYDYALVFLEEYFDVEEFEEVDVQHSDMITPQTENQI